MARPKKHVLCVDDNRQVCEIVASILTNAEVRVAFDIAGARAVAAIVQFDLFILDFYLPDGNGSELLQALRQTHPDTPAIFITTAHDISKEDAAELGAVDLIHKVGATFVRELVDVSEAILKE